LSETLSPRADHDIAYPVLLSDLGQGRLVRFSRMFNISSLKCRVFFIVLRAPSAPSSSVSIGSVTAGKSVAVARNVKQLASKVKSPRSVTHRPRGTRGLRFNDLGFNEQREDI
jgi:hypothetical protein